MLDGVLHLLVEGHPSVTARACLGQGAVARGLGLGEACAARQRAANARLLSRSGCRRLGFLAGHLRRLGLRRTCSVFAQVKHGRVLVTIVAVTEAADKRISSFKFEALYYYTLVRINIILRLTEHLTDNRTSVYHGTNQQNIPSRS